MGNLVGAGLSKAMLWTGVKSGECLLRLRDFVGEALLAGCRITAALWTLRKLPCRLCCGQ